MILIHFYVEQLSFILPLCFFRERCKFDPSWYPELTATIEDSTQYMGFSVEVMAAHASLIYAEHLGLDIDDPALWIPSERWCFWYLSEIAGYVKRRVTQLVKTIEQTEVHGHVHAYNVRQTAYLMSLGMHPKYISGSDGKGSSVVLHVQLKCVIVCTFSAETHLFLGPAGDWKWVKRGVKQVAAEGKGDKRACTGNLVINYTGVMFAVTIFDGKSESSLPSADAQKRCVLGSAFEHHISTC